MPPLPKDLQDKEQFAKPHVKIPQRTHEHMILWRNLELWSRET